MTPAHPCPSAPPRFSPPGAANSQRLRSMGLSPVAALFVEAGGSYFNLDGVDPWDEVRDARQYAGPWPVVAHPPCQRWGKFWAGQPLWIARTGERKIKGDDGGCFAAALSAVRAFGGVLEHPWGSHAWPHFGLHVPSRWGLWERADDYGWTCCVEQGRYGHYARKPTLLYAVVGGYHRLPHELRWGKSEPTFPQWAIDRYGLAKCKRAGELAFKGGGKDNHHRIGTPPEFRDLLLGIARSVPIRPHNVADAEPAATRCPSGPTALVPDCGATFLAANGNASGTPFVDCLGPGAVLSARAGAPTGEIV